MKLTARDILHEANMSSRPEYYSCRGAISYDLNYKLLTQIAALIEENHGASAKAEFVSMVAAMKRATATDFINSLYALERCDWNFTAAVDTNGIDVGPDGPGRYGAAMGTLVSILGGMSDRDETPYIRNQFLSENGIKVRDCNRFHSFRERGNHE